MGLAGSRRQLLPRLYSIPALKLSCIGHELRIARKIDGFRPTMRFSSSGPWKANVFKQFGLRGGRSCHQNRAGICNRNGDRVQTVAIRRSAAIASRLASRSALDASN